MNELLGKIIVGIFVSDDQHILSFSTTGSPVKQENFSTLSYETESDCCSETWFADIIGVSTLLGQKVLEVREVEDEWGIEVKDNRCREEDILYKIVLTTAKGHCDIIFRNSSNGYYGGEIGIYKGVLPENMIPITDDWQA